MLNLAKGPLGASPLYTFPIIIEFSPIALPPSAYGSAKQNNNFGFRVLGCFGLAVGLRLGMIEALRTAPTRECHRLQG